MLQLGADGTALPLDEAEKGAYEVSAPPLETDGVGEVGHVPIHHVSVVALVPLPAA